MDTLSGNFSTLTLLLSLVGLHGVMSFVVTQRTRETGIRLALGAQRRAAIWLILRDALTMTAAWIPARRASGVDPTDVLRVD